MNNDHTPDRDPLTTREGWARWVNSNSERFAMADDLDTLSRTERDMYDEERLDYISNSIVLNTPFIKHSSNTLRRLVILNQRQRSARRGLIINGRPGTGKSTTLTTLGRIHELNTRRRRPAKEPDTSIPVIHVMVPFSATPRMLAVEFARFLALPVATSARVNVTDVTEAVCQVACAVDTQLILVDELQNISLSTKTGSEVSDLLKYFAERIPATFVYAGFDLLEGGMFRGSRGRQIATRFAMTRTEPYYYGTDTQRREWDNVIAAFENALPLHRHRRGSLVRLADYIYWRTGGMIGSVSQLIRGGAIDAILDGSEQVTRDYLDAVELDLAAEEYAAGSTDDIDHEPGNDPSDHDNKNREDLKRAETSTKTTARLTPTAAGCR